MPNLIFNHIKSEQNRISWASEIKMMIIYRYIFWKTCLYDNSLFNLFFYIYWEFFRWLFIWKSKKWNLKIIIDTWKYLFKNYKKIDNRSVDFNYFIFKK
jgi:nicotinamide riboside transporter PnuC